MPSKSNFNKNLYKDGTIHTKSKTCTLKQKQVFYISHFISFSLKMSLCFQRNCNYSFILNSDVKLFSREEMEVFVFTHTCTCTQISYIFKNDPGV